MEELMGQCAILIPPHPPPDTLWEDTLFRDTKPKLLGNDKYLDRKIKFRGFSGVTIRSTPVIFYRKRAFSFIYSSFVETSVQRQGSIFTNKSTKKKMAEQ